MRRRHSQRGSTLPEAAIASVSALMLLLGIVDFGRAMYTYNYVGQLAREGARWAIVRGSTSCTNSQNTLPECNASKTQIISYVQSLSEGATKASSILVNPTYPTCPNGAVGSNAPGCTVAVQVTYPFTFIMGFVNTKLTYNMTSTSEMVISQ
jgi:Flp pilus assembly protein TadG